MTPLRSPTAPHLPSQADWPTREQALAIIAALDRLEEGTGTELDRLTGIQDAQIVAHRCYQVFGYPELEGVTFARRMAEAFMRPRGKATGTAPEAQSDIAPPDYTTGFTPRR